MVNKKYIGSIIYVSDASRLTDTYGYNGDVAYVIDELTKKVLSVHTKFNGHWTDVQTGSGGGGALDYEQINHKPQINNITLSGNKTSLDLGLLPSSTKYGVSISVTIDDSTYELATVLKDQDGNTLGTAQIIDLPLESMVVGGEYDDATKKIILTLKNGQTVEFSVADLVAGLQTEITANSKLSADLVDDSSTTNKFVSAAEKSSIGTSATKLTGISDSASNYIELANGLRFYVSSTEPTDTDIPDGSIGVGWIDSV